MAPRLPWLERSFDFDFPTALYPSFLERLRGLPARLEESVRGLAREVLVRRDGEKWSIQENAGHILDLEYLPAARVQDMLAGRERLTAWLGNDATAAAAHNERAIGDILRELRAARMSLVATLDSLAPDDFERAGVHPRLGTRMRMVDLLYFQAEHDDHHMARIQELKRRFGAA